MTAVRDSETSKMDAHETIGWCGEYLSLLYCRRVLNSFLIFLFCLRLCEFHFENQEINKFHRVSFNRNVENLISIDEQRVVDFCGRTIFQTSMR